MIYLVTGANGLVGNFIVEHLISNKRSVSALVHKNTDKIRYFKKLTLKRGNLLDYKSLTTVCQNVDIIIHCAAAINPKDTSEYYSVNFKGTQNLLKASSENKVKLFIYISSWSANNEGSDYSKSKFLAEKAVQKYPNYLIIRPADIYSKTQSHLINFIKTVNKYPVIPIVGSGEYKVSPIFINDLVKALFFLISNSKNNIHTITGPKIYSFNEITKLILKKLKKRALTVNIPTNLVYAAIQSAKLVNINLPLDKEKVSRLTTQRTLKNVFRFKSASIEPLNFEDALDRFLLKNSLNI